MSTARLSLVPDHDSGRARKSVRLPIVLAARGSGAWPSRATTVRRDQSARGECLGALKVRRTGPTLIQTRTGRLRRRLRRRVTNKDGPPRGGGPSLGRAGWLSRRPPGLVRSWFRGESDARRALDGLVPELGVVCDFVPVDEPVAAVADGARGQQRALVAHALLPRFVRATALPEEAAVGRAEVARIDAPLCGAGVRVLPHAATRDHDVELVALDVASRVRDLHDHVLASDRSRAGIVGVVLPLTRELDVIALAAGRVGHGDVTVGHVVRDGAGGLVVAGVGVSLLVLLAAGARRRSAHGRDAVGGACSGVPVVGPGTVGFAAVPIAARPPLGTTVQVRQVRGAA